MIFMSYDSSNFFPSKSKISTLKLSIWVLDILIDEEININLNDIDYRGFIKRINKNIDRLTF